MKFKELKLIEPLQMAIEKLNYTEATPIQEQAIPLLLEGRASCRERVLSCV